MHLFHLDRLWENLEHVRLAAAARRPIALSTIWWQGDEYDRRGRAGLQGWLACLAGSTAYQELRVLQRVVLQAVEQRRLPGWSALRGGFRRGAVELLQRADVLLPNSAAESAAIVACFGVRRPTVVVPNGVDTTVFAPPPAGARREGVLCVGRIEPRKNQLRLIEALRGTDIPLTLVGAAGRFSRRYARRCRTAAGPNVRFLPSQTPAALCRLYQSAAVHVNVSWYETPGLASLEAALCGCALVVTPGGCTREYFADEAVYTRPDDAADIRAAIEQALATGPAAGLAERVAREFNWERAAAATIAAYELALTAR